MAGNPAAVTCVTPNKQAALSAGIEMGTTNTVLEAFTEPC